MRLWWNRKKEEDKIRLESARRELEAAWLRQKRAVEQQKEVMAVTRESKEHIRGNGFYELFKQGLNGT